MEGKRVNKQVPKNDDDSKYQRRSFLRLTKERTGAGGKRNHTNREVAGVREILDRTYDDQMFAPVCRASTVFRAGKRVQYGNRIPIGSIV